jgi:beta-N-acetylhexosaminidase
VPGTRRMSERMLNQPLNEFMDQNFFGPLGLSTMTYNPLLKHRREIIAPTEDDNYFRKNLIWGTVHDQGAAMMGGVGGHAGLFANANDLAILMQMNLQNGNYGGHKYFNTNVVTEFSKRQFSNSRRGLGWDKPDLDGNGPTSNLASASTFGHTGFTGTGAWVDPENQLIYIFLSNRVYPDAGNSKLVKYNIRTRIHDVIYKSIVPKT